MKMIIAAAVLPIILVFAASFMITLVRSMLEKHGAKGEGAPSDTADDNDL